MARERAPQIRTTVLKNVVTGIDLVLANHRRRNLRLCCKHSSMRSNNVDCDAALIVTSCGDEQSNNSITITTTLKSV